MNFYFSNVMVLSSFDNRFLKEITHLELTFYAKNYSAPGSTKSFFFNYFVEVLHNEIVYLELDLSQGEAEGPELGRCVYGGGMK